MRSEKSSLTPRSGADGDDGSDWWSCTSLGLVLLGFLSPLLTSTSTSSSSLRVFAIDRANHDMVILIEVDSGALNPEVVTE